MSSLLHDTLRSSLTTVLLKRVSLNWECVVGIQQMERNVFLSVFMFQMFSRGYFISPSQAILTEFITTFFQIRKLRIKQLQSLS